MARSYKIRRFQNGKNGDGKPFFNYSITIPTEIATKLPEGMQYVCYIDEEGIHFKPMEEGTPPVELPEWAQRKPVENGAPKPKRAGGRQRPGAKA